MTSRIWVCTGVSFILLLSGCAGAGGGTESRQPVFKVKGKITMTGGPVANAIVSFSPKDKQPVATGRTSADGTYTLTTYDAGDGAAVGDYVVLVIKPNSSSSASPTDAGHDPNKPPDGDAMHAAQSAAAGGVDSGSLLPEKYSRPDQSNLTAKVESKSENVFDFDLKP